MKKVDCLFSVLTFVFAVLFYHAVWGKDLSPQVASGASASPQITSIGSQAANEVNQILDYLSGFLSDHGYNIVPNDDTPPPPSGDDDDGDDDSGSDQGDGGNEGDNGGGTEGDGSDKIVDSISIKITFTDGTSLSHNFYENHLSLKQISH